MMAAHRWFSAAVVITLALGIGLNTMVFTGVNAVLIKPLAVPGGERLVVIRNQRLPQRNEVTGVSLSDFRDYRALVSSLESLQATTREEAVLSEQGNPPQSFRMQRVSFGLFEMLHTPPVLGRGFAESDDKPGADPVILLGHGVWKDRYGRAPGIVGHVVRANGKPATIVGVMPEGFRFPQLEDLWMPLAPTPDLEKRWHRPLELIGMLKPGVSIAQATAEFQGVTGRLATQYPDTNKGLDVLVETFQQRYRGRDVGTIFLLMQAAVGAVLLIACANVANMMLSASLGRRREIAIRAALGASRWQIVRQLLIESMLLSTLGGMLGLALAVWGIRAFDLATRDAGKPYWIEFTMDYRVFAYFAALCIASGLLFGLAPALRASRVDLNSALKDGIRSAGTHRGGKLSGALVVFQFALTLVLLTSAGMFVRGLLKRQFLNRGVPADQLLTARLRLPQDRYPDWARRIRFFEQLLPRLKAIPGVTHAALGSNLPGMGAGTRRIEIEDAPLANPTLGPSASVLVPSPGYFTTIELPILSGRDFNDQDGTPGRQSAIVSQEFAERHWPRHEAVGKRFRLYWDDKPDVWIAVVGVAANIVQQPNETKPDPLLYVPYRQEGDSSAMLLVRSAGPASTASAVRAAVQNMDQDLALAEVGTLTAAMARQQVGIGLIGTLFFIFAMVALVMASVGIYAVMAQAATRRTQEIGVRMALGATSLNILGLVLSRGLLQLTAGLALGLLAAFPAARLLAFMPLGVSSSDPIIFAAVSLLLTLVGLLACWLPARRAAALDPMMALRDE
jgi:predicted permease